VSAKFALSLHCVTKVSIIAERSKNNTNNCSTFFSGLTTTQTHRRRAVWIISCKGTKNAQSFCKKTSDAIFIPLHLEVLWWLFWYLRLIRCQLVISRLLFWGVKSWLKFFNPTPSPEVIWSEDSWILDSIFGVILKLASQRRKKYGHYPVILTPWLVNKPYSYSC